MFKWTKLLGIKEVAEEDVRLTAAGCTDTGQRRERNEDAFLLANLDHADLIDESEANEMKLTHGGFLLVVADGLGGHAGGEIASRIAVKVMRDEMIRNHLEPDIEQRLLSAVQTANKRLREYAAHHVQVKGLGTTLTAAYIRKNMAYIAHVGDSRAYLLRGGRLRQLTHDQTLAQYLLDLGQARRAQSASQHILMQAVGTEAHIAPTFTQIELRQDDCLLLCSDGLSNKFRDEELAQAINDAKNVKTLTRQLVTQANERGGEDNITVIAARFSGKSLLPAHQPARARDAITLEMPAAA